MMKRLFPILFFAPLLVQAQYCENFNVNTKSQLLSSGWQSWPSAAWSINTTGAYDFKSAVVNTGAGTTVMLASPCLQANSTLETFSLYYIFNYGSGMFRVGIQSPNSAIGTGVTWLDTMPVVNAWTYASVSFTPAYNPYKILLYYGNVIATTKFGVDNFYLANSTNLGSSCSLMPIEISSFSATVEGNQSSISKPKIKLDWETASEKNSNSFVILRAYDNLNFDSIASVKASGYSTAPLSYSYEDAISNSVEIYYRLKLVDNDGSYSLTDVVSVAPQGQAFWFVSDGILHYSGTESPLLLIYSVPGELVHSEKLTDDVVKDLHFLPPGFYLAKISGSFNDFKSFVIH